MYVRFNGNPFIKVSLNKEAKNYVRQNYPEIADKVQLSPQGVYVGHYNDTPVFLAYFSNPDDKLMYFHLMYDKDGNLLEKQDMGLSTYAMRPETVYYNPADGDPATWVDGVPGTGGQTSETVNPDPGGQTGPEGEGQTGTEQPADPGTEGGTGQPADPGTETGEEQPAGPDGGGQTETEGAGGPDAGGEQPSPGDAAA